MAVDGLATVLSGLGALAAIVGAGLAWRVLRLQNRQLSLQEKQLAIQRDEWAVAEATFKISDEELWVLRQIDEHNVLVSTIYNEQSTAYPSWALGKDEKIMFREKRRNPLFFDTVDALLRKNLIERRKEPTLAREVCTVTPSGRGALANSASRNPPKFVVHLVGD